MWKRFTGRVDGIEVKGEPGMPASSWWKIPFLILFYWDTVQVFEMTASVGRYRVGFVPFDGPTRLRSKPVLTRQFAARIGREDCRFFAVDNDGTELPLKAVRRMKKRDLPDSITLV